MLEFIRMWETTPKQNSTLQTVLKGPIIFFIPQMGPLPNSNFLYPYYYLYLFNLPFFSLNHHHHFTLFFFLLPFSLTSPSMADSGSASDKRMSCSIPERFQLHAAMLALQFGYAGFHVVSRAALNMGISKLVFPVYRNVIALLLLLPFAYFIEK